VERKVVKEQAAEVDRLRAGVTSAARQMKDMTLEAVTENNKDTFEDDTSDCALPDSASVDLTQVSQAQLVDLTRKAIAVQVHFTTMHSTLSTRVSTPLSVDHCP